MTMQERMDTKKGEDRERDENLCQKFLLRYICRRSWREDSLFVSREREKKVRGRMLDATQQSGSPFLV